MLDYKAMNTIIDEAIENEKKKVLILEFHGRMVTPQVY